VAILAQFWYFFGARGIAPPTMSPPEERLTQRRGIETRPFPQGALLVDMDTGKCYRLNRVGAEIWELLRQPVGVTELCAEVAKKYERGAETLEGDVRELVAHLVKEKLVDGPDSVSAP
jgi:hypothetical protein